MTEAGLKTETFMVNMGPQHPSTHGVLRLVLVLDGETVVDLKPVVGYLHRGVERLCEEGTYLQNITLTDRLDYLSPMTNNWAYALAVEELAGIEVPERAEHLRVIVGELQRIANHLVAVGSFAADIGTYFTPFMYCFRERELILDLFERISGARMTHSYICPGGVRRDADEVFIAKTKQFLSMLPRRIEEYEAMLTTNEVFLARTKGVGVLPPDVAVNFSVSGPSLRGSGVRYDLRRAVPYGIYSRFDFRIPVGEVGDCFDRYMVRIEEMRQSLRIVQQALEQLPKGEIMAKVPRLLRPPAGEAFSRIEAPKGELGFFIVSDGSVAPYRCKIRAPSFINLGVLREIVVGLKVADVVACLGSIDVVLGEVDR
ncbi:MAG: NADH-quinone oxidoreductase subunit D [Chloroflexota bacterium]